MVKVSIKSLNESKEDININIPIIDSSDEHLIYLVNKYQRNAKRKGTASSKTRSDVSYTGAKSYKQKGTGRARTGSKRSPLRRGGGVIFGPKPRSFSVKLNKKQYRSSLGLLISKVQSKITYIVSKETEYKNTRDVKNLLALMFKNNQKITLVGSFNEHQLIRSARNLPIKITHIESIDYELLLNSDKIVFSENALLKVSQNV
ncbi:MAG: 50S ribosomal protein L4 [bacterium]